MWLLQDLADNFLAFPRSLLGQRSRARTDLWGETAERVRKVLGVSY